MRQGAAAKEDVRSTGVGEEERSSSGRQGGGSGGGGERSSGDGKRG